MKFDDLIIFKEIAETGNVSGASINLYKDVSSVNRSIKKFEEDLGYKLFIRDQGKMILTEEGENALILVNEIMNRVDSLYEVNGHKDPIPVSICATDVETLSFISASFVSVNKSRKYSVTGHYASNEEIENALKNGNCDIAITTKPIFIDKGVIVFKYDDNPTIVKRQDNHNDVHTIISLEDCQGREFAVLGKMGSKIDLLETYIRNKKLNIKLEYNISESLFYSKVLNGNSSAIVGQSIAKSFSNKQLNVQEISNKELITSVYITVTEKNNDLVALVRSFLKKLPGFLELS